MPDMNALYTRLADADEAQDADALAALAWELYGLLGTVAADLTALRARLHNTHAWPPGHVGDATLPCQTATGAPCRARSSLNKGPLP